MSRKTDLITDLYRQTVKTVTSSERDWMAFLRTAAWQYKYPFSDQVCIYAQKPDTVACAEIAIWNRLDRWVNRGAHGIALIRDNGGRPVLSHVFDVTAVVRLNSGRWRTGWSRRSPKRWRTGSGNCRRNGPFLPPFSPLSETSARIRSETTSTTLPPSHTEVCLPSTTRTICGFAFSPS